MDAAALAKRLLRPARPHLAEARRIVAAAAGAEAAWSELVARGLAPSPAAKSVDGTPLRRFLVDDGTCSSCHGSHRIGGWRPCPDCRATGRSTRVADRPATLDECVAFADAEAMLRAEALGREVARRVAQWYGTPPATVVCSWRVLDDQPAEPSTELARVPAIERGILLFSTTSSVSLSVRGALRRHAGEPPEPPPGVVESWEAPLSLVVPALFVQQEEWRRAAALGLTPYQRPGRAAPSAPFAELDDPYEPIFALLDTGYLLDAVLYGDVRLFAPAV